MYRFKKNMIYENKEFYDDHVVITGQCNDNSSHYNDIISRYNGGKYIFPATAV